VDLVYHPLRTSLVAAAQERGATAVGGLGMLVYQAARSFQYWTGLEAPTSAMRSAATEAASAPGNEVQAARASANDRA
jgi:shikimate dehydrogenase